MTYKPLIKNGLHKSIHEYEQPNDVTMSCLNGILGTVIHTVHAAFTFITPIGSVINQAYCFNRALFDTNSTVIA
jgi:hypothetical protein